MKGSDKETRQIVKDLGIGQHLNLFDRLRIRYDERRIATEQRPSVEIVYGMIFRADRQDSITFPLVEELAEGLEGVRNGGRGDKIVTLALSPVVCWSRLNANGDTVLLDEEGQVKVRVASVLSCYGDNGQSTVPLDTPIDGVVAWEYNERGRLVGGRFLPLDLDVPWFDSSVIGQSVVTTSKLYPVHGRKRGEVEGLSVHPSGKRMVCNFPINWGQQDPYSLREFNGVMFLVPLPTVEKAGNEAAVEEAAEAAAGENAVERVEVVTDLRPEEYVSGKERGLIKVKLAKYGVDETSTVEALKRALKKANFEKHPDTLQGRLAKRGTAKDVIDQYVADANMQWPAFGAAFERALAAAESREVPVEPKAPAGTEGGEKPQTAADKPTARAQVGARPVGRATKAKDANATP